MYQALYRKWRPKIFDDVVGQKHITETLKNQIITGRLSHAYLFIGTRGTGKTTCAKILAKAVNCEHPVNGNPCNKCRSCLGIDDGSIMDVVEMDAASNNGVDNVRALRDEAVFSPAAVKKRVYIVDEVHMLSGAAFNALLKILEEPPAHLMFILATTELNKVPATILSRCQRHCFKRLDMKSLTERLAYVAQQEQLTLSKEAAVLIARLSDGGMRDALSLLDQCSGNAYIDVDSVYSAMGLAGIFSTAQLLQYITVSDTASALQLFQQLWQEGKEPSSLLNELSTLMRDILISKVAPNGGNELLSGGYDDVTIKAFETALSSAALVNNIGTIQSTLSAMKGGQAKTLCELCIISLCEPEINDDVSHLAQRVAKLEAGIADGNIGVCQAEAPRTVPENNFTAEINTPTPIDEVPFDIPEHEETLSPPPNSYNASAFIPETPTFSAETSDTGDWNVVISKLNGKLPVGIMAMLTDPMSVSCAFENDVLRLSVDGVFALNNINRPDVLSVIGEAATSALGKHYRVEANEAATDVKTVNQPVQRKTKLDELGKYDIVVFK